MHSFSRNTNFYYSFFFPPTLLSYTHLFKSVPISWILHLNLWIFLGLLWMNHVKKNVNYMYRQWHWSILGNTTSQAGADEVLKKPNLPPRGVPNPNGAQSRFTARLSDLYGTNNSSGHLWTSAKMISTKIYDISKGPQL